MSNELKEKLEEFVDILEKAVSENGLISSDYLNFLDENFDENFISLVLHNLGVLKFQKNQYMAAQSIFNYAISHYKSKNPYTHLLLGITYCQFRDAKLAKEKLNEAKNLLSQEEDSHLKRQRIPILNKYLSYFNDYGDEILICDKILEEHKHTTIYYMGSHIDQQNSNIGIGVTQAKTEAKNIAGLMHESQPESQEQNLRDIASEIENLLRKLDASYSTDSTSDKMQLAAEAIKQIDNNNNLSSRIVSALKTGSIEALEQLLNHPAASFVIGALKDWYKNKKNNQKLS